MNKKKLKLQIVKMIPILDVKQLGKTYSSGAKDLMVLNDVSFTLYEKDTFAIVGPSGSGKTTLLGLCAGLDSPGTGTVTLCGTVVNDLNEDEKALLRNEKVGFIFQNFQLIPTLTALENVIVPLELQGVKHAKNIGIELLDKVGLMERKNHYPSQLSGGEQQRVSLARAFSNKPKILFADEPTGNLDHETGEKVIKLLFDLNADAGTTLVIVTHDMDLAERTQRVLKLKGGKIISDQSVSIQ